MKRTLALLAAAAAALGAAGSVHALYSVSNEGTWPKSWPAQLEPLRKRSRTLEGPMTAHRHHAIPFTKRAEFEAAWPHLLKVKTRGAPVLLVRGPNFFLGKGITAGVVVHSPPIGQSENPATPEAPINSPDVRERWLYTTYIEVVVDGKVIDANRLRLPAGTPVIDERNKPGLRVSGAVAPRQAPAAKLTVEVGAGEDVKYAAVSSVLSAVRKSAGSQGGVSLRVQKAEGISARVHASPEVAYRDLRVLLDALKTAGVERVTLRVE